MRKDLALINFTKILHYHKIYGYSRCFKGSYKCTGYCIDCEKKGLLKNNEYLSSISHGADSKDFYAFNKKQFCNNVPVMFLFMDPSPANEKEDMGQYIPYKGSNKYVPNDCYYWINENHKQPIKTINDLINSCDLYSGYIIYLINKYKLNNIYVTNMQKCLLKNGKESKNNIEKNCIYEYLFNEIKLFNPSIFICFGKVMGGHFCSYLYNTTDLDIIKIKDNSTIIKITHPGARKNKYKLITENEKILDNELNPALVKYNRYKQRCLFVRRCLSPLFRSVLT